jgi:hypothetical protein
MTIVNFCEQNGLKTIGSTININGTREIKKELEMPGT